MCGQTQKQSQNQTSTTTPSAQANALYGNIIGKATDASNGFQYDPATGKSIAEFTPDQLAAFSGVQSAQGTGRAATDAAGNLITQGASSISPEEIANYTNPHQQAVIDAAVAQAQRSNATAQSGVAGNAASMNALGGNRVGVAQAQLAGEQGRNDNSMVAGLLSQGYDRATALAQADKVRQQTGANQQMNLGQLQQSMSYADLQALMASGQAQQTQAQNVNDAASANATAEQMAPFQNAQWLAGIGAGIGPLTGGTTKSTGTSTTSTPKGVGQYVGAGLTAASMLSDRRTKENSRIIGKTFDGQNVHEFNYKGSPKRQIGLMADEVRKSHPDAVGQHPSGMEMVDYGRATDDSAERGHFASGGGVGDLGGNGFASMWNELRPAAPTMPQPMQFAAPAAAPPSPSMQESMKLGSSARAGIDGILSKLSPSKGWNAGTTIEPTSGAGTGSLASLGSMFGFAPGGAVDFESFGDTANGRSKRHRLNDEFIGQIGPSADPYYGIAPQGEAGGIPAAESPWGMSGISPTYQGRTLADFIGGIPNMPERGYREPVADISAEPMPTQGPDSGNGLTPMPERGYRAPAAGTMSLGDMDTADLRDWSAAPQTAQGAPAAYGETRNAAPGRNILDAIEMQESGGRDNLVSSAGARGPMQIMPATARNPGYGIAPMKNINDPAENRRFGAEYFGAMLKEFGGDEQAALIAYNGGPARAKEWLAAGRDDRVLPAETSNYYKQVAERMASGEPGGPSRDALGEPSRDVLGEPSRDVPGAGFTSQTGNLVARAMSPDAEPASAGYSGVKDKAVGGLLKSLFGKEFNPLNISENERMAVMAAGLSMMSNGDIGGGGMKGIDFLNKANTADRDTAMDERKFRMAERKDERDAVADAQKLKLSMRQLDLAGAGRWSLSPDGTTLVNDASGETRPTGARKEQADTPAMKEYALATRQGFEGTFAEFEQERKAQNVKGQLSGEIGARLGLGDQFVREFPGIRARVAKGFGVGAVGHSVLKGGELASVQREIATGMDALVRMNTGAAMPASEEANYNNRYQISATDSNATKLAKIDKLKTDLLAARQGIIDGNSGVTVRGGISAQKAPNARRRATDANGNAVEYDGRAWVPAQ